MVTPTWKTAEVEGGALVYRDHVVEQGRGFREYEREGAVALAEYVELEDTSEAALHEMLTEAFVFDREGYIETVVEVTYASLDLPLRLLSGVLRMLDE